MRKAISNLIEAVRSLQLTVIDVDGTRMAAPEIDEVRFKAGLLELYDALQEVDADAAASLDSPDPEKLKAAIEATFRWIRLQGLNVDEPVARVAEAMGSKVEKRKPRYDILPTFSPSHNRKKGAWKPRLRFPTEQFRNMHSIDAHRSSAIDMGQVLSKMGSAAPVDVADLKVGPKV